MNKNHFKTTGFSNTNTQQWFESWSEELCLKLMDEEKLCGFCCHSRFVSDGEWVVCLNADSPYCYETLCSSFICASFATTPNLGISHIQPD